VKITKVGVVMAKQTALWKYFTTKEPTKEETVEAILPKPDGLLSTSMPSSAIAAANSAVREYRKYCTSRYGTFCHRCSEPTRKLLKVTR